MNCAGDALEQSLWTILPARAGHFVLESGHHGDLWLDLDALFRQPAALGPFAAELAKRLACHHIDTICGPQAGGAILAQIIAAELGIESVEAQRTTSPTVTYRIPDALRSRLRDKRIAIVDDIVNAGSAVRATLADVRACGAQSIVIAALALIGPAPGSFATEMNLPVESLSQRSTSLWEPANCPLCAYGVPLQF